MNYYERHIGDYLKDTAHLSLLEHGIYSRLLDVYYTRECPLPEEDIARLVGARSPAEKAALLSVVSEFFVTDHGNVSQPRCDREILRFKDKQRKAKASADARWSHIERNAKASPNAMRTHSEGNAPSLQTPDTTTEAKLPPVVSPKARHSRRCPADFLVTADLQAWAREHAPMVDIRAETATFRDYEFGKTASDWPARWRIWMTKEQKRLAEVAKRNGSNGETPWQRSQRERAAEIHPAIARAAPGQPKTNPMEVLDGLVRIAR